MIEKLSVFLPCYNEEENIENTALGVRKTLEEVAKEWELLIINDGSTDKSEEIAKKLNRSDPRIKVITHSKNQGYGATLSTGFGSCRHPWISFIDSDGQFDFGEIKNFLQKQQETNADLVIGYYKKRRVSFLKIVTSKIWEYTVFALFGLKVHDIDCGFKLISKKVIDKITPFESKRGAFISSELLIKAKKAGFKISQIPVTHYPRTKGTGTGRNLNVIIRSFADLLTLWRKLK